MGLQINRTTNYGVTLNYFNIRNIDINWTLRSSIVTLNAYISEVARKDGLQAAEDVAFNFSDDETGNNFFFVDSANIRQQAYDKIKTLDGWEDALDVWYN